MESNLIFVKRTEKEFEIFGGEVYIDIDGKNVGLLGNNNIYLSVSSCQHKLKMYKTHTMGSIIGIAEIDISVSCGKKLLIRYVPPLIISQPGNIIVSDFLGDYQINEIVSDREKKLGAELEQKKEQLEQQHQKNTYLVLIFILLIIFSSVIWIIYVNQLMDF